MQKQFVEKQKIKVVVLVGGRDFGRSPLASRLPTALWPVAGKSVLERLLVHLADQGIEQALICSSGNSSLLAESIQADNRLKLKFVDESLPMGTAGCIRNAASDGTDALVVVFPASIVCPPKIHVLINAHHEGQSDLTVMLNPCYGNGGQMVQASGIYVCNSGCLELIPEGGYFDIKEGLIPEMLRAGKTVHAAKLPNHSGNFRDRQEYLCAISNYLEENPKLDTDLRPFEGTDSQIMWIASNANVDQGARIYGPAVIMAGASISSGVVILGPTVIGRNASIGKDSVVINSVLWDSTKVGPNCEIQRCVIEFSAVVRANTQVEEKSILFKSEGMLRNSVCSTLKIAKNNASRLQHTLQQRIDEINKKLPESAQPDRKSILTLLGTGLILIAFLWSYWPNLADLWNLWQRSDEYSSGLLVPFLAVYILWSRRGEIAQCRIKPAVWGLFAFIGAQFFRLFGLFFMYGSAERLSITLSVAALVLFLFGWQLFRKVFTVLLFLCLMLPWPNRVQDAVAMPLQHWATSSAVFCLEMIGYEVIQEGNIIHIGQATVAVAEACNGLRMVTAFFVISGLVVLLVKRTWWEKLIVLASSLPIALMCNTVRLAITAMFFTFLEGEQWEKIFHDFGGYAMMPLALAVVVAELWLLAKLTTLPDKKQAIIITRQNR